MVAGGGAFAVAWWVCQGWVGLDGQTAVGVATVAGTLVGGPFGWWASRDMPVREIGSPPVPLPQPVAPPQVVRIEVEVPRSETATGAAGVGGPVVSGAIPHAAVALRERPELLAELAARAGGGRPVVVCAVTGGRGIGKTQLAAAYARARVADGWPVVAWVVAEDEQEIIAGLAELADAAGVRPPESDSLTAARAASQWLRTRVGPCLLVFDNAIDADVVARWLPSVGAVQVVVTTVRGAVRQCRGAGGGGCVHRGGGVGVPGRTDRIG
jgi:hypothetical protein